MWVLLKHPVSNPYKFGANERQNIADQYNISVYDNSAACRSRIWTEFESVINAQQSLMYCIRPKCAK